MVILDISALSCTSLKILTLKRYEEHECLGASVSIACNKIFADSEDFLTKIFNFFSYLLKMCGH